VAEPAGPCGDRIVARIVVQESLLLRVLCMFSGTEETVSEGVSAGGINGRAHGRLVLRSLSSNVDLV